MLCKLCKEIDKLGRRCRPKKMSCLWISKKTIWEIRTFRRQIRMITTKEVDLTISHLRLIWWWNSSRIKRILEGWAKVGLSTNKRLKGRGKTVYIDWGCPGHLMWMICLTLMKQLLISTVVTSILIWVMLTQKWI